MAPCSNAPSLAGRILTAKLTSGAILGNIRRQRAVEDRV